MTPGPGGRRGLAGALLGRCLHAACALWVCVTVTFALMHAVPGGPFSSLQLPAASRALLTARYGLDRPLLRQYAVYVGNALHGELGWSLVDPRVTVASMIRRGLPVSGLLGALALLWSVPAGLALGLRGALRPGGPWDRVAGGVALLGLAVPNFVLAAAADYFLGVRIRLLPVAGWGTPAQAVLPALALGALPLALVARMARAQAAEVLRTEYVRAARAKGLSWGQTLRRHVLRNSLLPVLTLLGPLASVTVAGSFVVETAFAVPGLGAAFVGSILDRDYPLILGLTVFYCALLLGFNLLADLAHLAADPRLDAGL